MKKVSIKHSKITIPTYLWGGDDREAPFIKEFTPRGQPVYPYTPQEEISAEKEDREYKSVIFENEFLILTFLPEMNGRLYSSYDKVNKREMFYNNPQMKPSLFGLRGAWCANGIEYNFPNSHSTTTLEPVEWRVQENKDGSASFVCGDCERVSRMIWCVEVILRPDAASIEINTKLHNPTEYPKRFYYWMNAAVPIYDETRFIYPESTKRLYTHPPMDISRIAYLDYPVHKGRDISFFKNIPQHFPVFAEEMKDDFFGVYHHHLGSGLVHVADHALVRGRKIWMFGNQRDGRIWIDLLTDSGIDYCEVQTGPFSLQSDYRLLAPGKTHIQKDVWIPTGKLGGFNAASEKIIANIRRENGTLNIKLSAASYLSDCLIELSSDDKIISQRKISLEALKIEEQTIPFSGNKFKIEIFDNAKNLLLTYAPNELDKSAAIPEYKEHGNLALQGEYWEQQGHPEKAYDFYSRDNSTKSLIAKARMDMDSGLFKKAVETIEDLLRVDAGNAEALFYAGICMKKAGKFSDAETYFSRCRDNADFIMNANIQLAEISVMQNRYLQAKNRLEQLGVLCSYAYPAALYALCQRKSGNMEAAAKALKTAEKILPFEPLVYGECFLQRERKDLSQLRPQMLIEVISRYINLNEQDAAATILAAYFQKEKNGSTALLSYYKAFLEGTAPPEKVLEYYNFVSREESAKVLEYAVAQRSDDSYALYHLGNYCAAKRRWDDALNCWEKVTGAYKSLSLRGEGIYWWKAVRNHEQAAEYYKQATDRDCGAKTLWEYDHLLEEMDDLKTRIKLFEKHETLVKADKRLLLRKAACFVKAEKPEDALEILMDNSFPLCEGKILPRLLFEDSCRQLGERYRKSKNFEKALEYFMKPLAYPENLGVGKPAANMEAEWFWRCGGLCSENGKKKEAEEFFRNGTCAGSGIPIDFFPLRNLVWQHGPEMIELPVWTNILFRAACSKELGNVDEFKNTASLVCDFIMAKKQEKRDDYSDIRTLERIYNSLIVINKTKNY